MVENASSISFITDIKALFDSINAFCFSEANFLPRSGMMKDKVLNISMMADKSILIQNITKTEKISEAIW